MKLPAVASLGTKPWLKIDGLGAALGQLGGSSPNPTSQAELLRGLDNVKTIGREEIDGVGTTHYTGTIDFKKALAETQAKLGADSPLSKQLAQSQATFGDQMVIPASVWIDDQYRPRRIEFSVTAAGKTVQMTMDYSNFGEPVVVTAPPASDVQDMSSVGDLLGQLDPTTSTLPGV
jgi:hypothetical protein